MKKSATRNDIKYFLLLLIVLIFQGCSTLQHMVPGRPLKKDEVECRFSVGISTNNFNIISMQFAAFTGVTDNDALGFTFGNLFVPSSISYVRYWSNGDYYWNYQFHLNDLWGSDYNPEYETDIALSKIDNHSVHSIKFGIGYYTTPVIPYLFGKNAGETAIVPVIGYEFQNTTIRLEAEAIPGMAKYFVKRYKSVPFLYSDADSINKFEHYRNTRRVYTHNEVKGIEQIGADYNTAEWRIALADGDTLLLRNRDPYAECFYCSKQRKEFEAYKASDNNRVLWLYLDNFGWVRKSLSPILIEVNMRRIIKDFNQGKDLNLLSDKDLLEKSLQRIPPVFDDLFISVGHTWSGN